MDPALDEVIDRLTWEMTSWKTLSLKVREDYVRAIGDGSAWIEHEYRETSSGQRYYRSKFTDVTGRTSYEQVSCDGQRCWNSTFGPDGGVLQVVIARSIVREQNTGFTIRPKPLAMMYAGLTPLDEAIQRAIPAGSDLVIGRPCDLYRISGVKIGSNTLEIVYYLDHETSVPLRVVFLRRPDYSLKTPQTIWEADSLDSVNAYHIPMRSHFVAYGPPDEFGAQKEVVRQNVTVESIEYDKPIDAQFFKPQIEPGVTVVDTLGSAVARKSAPSQVAAPAAPRTEQPRVEAVAPESWTSYGPTVGLGVGVSAIVVGIVLWIRRGRS